MCSTWSQPEISTLSWLSLCWCRLVASILSLTALLSSLSWHAALSSARLSLMVSSACLTCSVSGLERRESGPVTHLQLCSPLQTVKPAAQHRVGLVDVTDNLPPVLAYSITDSLQQWITVTLTDPSSSASRHSLSPRQPPRTFGHVGLRALTVGLFVPIEVTNYILNWGIELRPGPWSRC